MYVIFHLKEKGQETINDLTADDEVGRLTIMTRDASKISDDLAGLLVLVEGPDRIVEKAVDIIGDRGARLEGDRASQIYATMKGESEDADQGVGFLFGG